MSYRTFNGPRGTFHTLALVVSIELGSEHGSAAGNVINVPYSNNNYPPTVTFTFITLLLLLCLRASELTAINNLHFLVAKSSPDNGRI